MTPFEKETAILNTTVSAAYAIADLAKHIPSKRIFPKRDRLERVRRKQKRLAYLNISLNAFWAAVEIQKIASTPTRKPIITNSPMVFTELMPEIE